MRKKKVAVWYWPGTNCEVESLKSWELLGADAELVFAKHFVSGAKKVTDYDLHHWTGGFTYGDDAGAGSIAALMAKEAIEILKGAGLPVIMECNGFQIGMRADVFGPGLALVQNDSGEFCSMPVLHRVVKSDCLGRKDLREKFLDSLRLIGTASWS